MQIFLVRIQAAELIDRAMRPWYAAIMRDPETHAKQELARYHARRASAILLLGGKCAKCGTTNNLQFDHINAQDKSFDLGKFWSCAENKFLAELLKCQLLCLGCHKRKTKHNGESGGGHNYIPDPQHGTAHMYIQYSCRCVDCRYARSLHRKGTLGYNVTAKAPEGFVSKRGRPSGK